MVSALHGVTLGDGLENRAPFSCVSWGLKYLPSLMHSCLDASLNHLKSRISASLV